MSKNKGRKNIMAREEIKQVFENMVKWYNLDYDLITDNWEE